MGNVSGLRELTPAELELVSGGVWTDGFGNPEISVTGGDLWYPYNMWGDASGYGGGVGGDSGGGDGAPAPPEPNETPCVETQFENGVSTHAANRAALQAANEIATLNDENIEYSSIVWSLDGEVGYTTPYTDNNDDAVNLFGGLSEVPRGATILGIVHNHPDQSGIDDRIPSGGQNNGKDWGAYNTIVNYNANHPDSPLPRNITVDPNMLLWIYSNEDGKVRPYDKTDKSQQSPSCPLN